jgi:enediyne biosynthesis protein E4
MKQIPRILAIAILFVLYGFTRPSDISNTDKEDLAEGFNFEKSVLYQPSNIKPIYIHQVHPQYKKIDAWISLVGAAVNVTDFDGDKLPNDIIHVDPRYNLVLISPAKGTGDRFKPIELMPRQLPYNPESMPPSGTLTDDFNQDGKIDIMVNYLGRSPIIFYQSDNGFIEAELNPTVEKWFTTTSTIADLDGDGHNDIFIGNYFPDGSRLYEKDATGNDQVMQHSFSRGDNGAVNRIFLWAGIKDGKAIFKESMDWRNGLEFNDDWTLAVAAADLNGDMLPEVYVANDFAPDKLLLNKSTPGHLVFKELKGKKGFMTIRSSVLGRDSFKGMGVDFGDINGDGLLDIYVSNIADNFALHESHYAFINTGDIAGMEQGIAPFVNESEKLGLSRSSWGWEAKLCDFNNDGVLEAIQATGFRKGKIDRWPELQELAFGHDEFIANPDNWPKINDGDDISGHSHIPFFVKHKSGKYYDISANIDIDEYQATRGIATADIEHDGKLDFVSAAQWQDSKLYHNTGNTNNTFLGLRLMNPLKPEMTDVVVDPKDETYPEKYAVGAKAIVTLKDGKKLVGYVDGGNGHTGKRSSEIHFGLGSININQVQNVELSWRKSNGLVASTKVQLKPGWHTISLPY